MQLPGRKSKYLTFEKCHWHFYFRWHCPVTFEKTAAVKLQLSNVTARWHCYWYFPDLSFSMSLSLAITMYCHFLWHCFTIPSINFVKSHCHFLDLSLIFSMTLSLKTIVSVTFYVIVTFDGILMSLLMTLFDETIYKFREKSLSLSGSFTDIFDDTIYKYRDRKVTIFLCYCHFRWHCLMRHLQISGKVTVTFEICHYQFRWHTFDAIVPALTVDDNTIPTLKICHCHFLCHCHFRDLSLTFSMTLSLSL